LISETGAVPTCHSSGLEEGMTMSEDNRDNNSHSGDHPGGDDSFPPPNNADTQAEQAADLTEPAFDHVARYETELLTAEFGPPDSDGVYGRNPDASLLRPAGRADIEGRLS
jgi:hypothetical protein